MAVIEVYKCGKCKKVRSSKADAEFCEQLHQDVIPLLDNIKTATNMESFLKAYACLIETVCSVKVVQVAQCEIETSCYNSAAIEELKIQLVLTAEPKFLSPKEFNRVGLEIFEVQGQWMAEIKVNGPNRYNESTFNKHLSRYLKDREALMRKKSRNNENWQIKEEIGKKVEETLLRDDHYKKLLVERKNINKEMQEIKKKLWIKYKKESSVNSFTLQIEGLDIDWINMPVLF